MNRSNNEHNVDAQFFDITRHLSDLDRALPPRCSGPRDWDPAPSPDEAFDPGNLPSPPPSEPSSLFAQIMLGLSIAFTVIVIVSSFHLIPLPGWLFGAVGLAAFISIATTIVLHLPRHRDTDDDGAYV